MMKLYVWVSLVPAYVPTYWRTLEIRQPFLFRILKWIKAYTDNSITSIIIKGVGLIEKTKPQNNWLMC
jgi:hypothetical protein